MVIRQRKRAGRKLVEYTDKELSTLENTFMGLCALLLAITCITMIIASKASQIATNVCLIALSVCAVLIILRKLLMVIPFTRIVVRHCGLFGTDGRGSVVQRVWAKTKAWSAKASFYGMLAALIISIGIDLGSIALCAHFHEHPIVHFIAITVMVYCAISGYIFSAAAYEVSDGPKTI